MDASLVALDSNVDQALLTDFQVHSVADRRVVLLDAASVLVRKVRNKNSKKHVNTSSFSTRTLWIFAIELKKIRVCVSFIAINSSSLRLFILQNFLIIFRTQETQ